MSIVKRNNGLNWEALKLLSAKYCEGSSFDRVKERNELLGINRFKCCYCLREVGRRSQGDRLVGTNRGGSCDRLNRIPCCSECNGAKRNRDTTIWLHHVKDDYPKTWDIERVNIWKEWIEQNRKLLCIESPEYYKKIDKIRDLIKLTLTKLQKDIENIIDE